MSEYSELTEKVRSLCHPRWVGWKPHSKIDPCPGCPLYRPCVYGHSGAPGRAAVNQWIDGINEAAEKLSE